nr:ORF1 [Epsilontorquevirus sp.]
MAYWWRRRRYRRPRRGRWRARYRRWRNRRWRRPRKRYGRRRFRRRRKRRGRRRHKVRYLNPYRKIRKRVIRQWEPNSKTFCKITGRDQALWWGSNAEFRVLCDNQPWPIKTGEWEGGSMNVMQYTLQFLYIDQQLGKNRWSRSNQGYDLVKYYGTKIWFPRHPTISYVVLVLREGHLTLETDTYQNLHPEKMLNARKKILVQSMQLRPKGRPYIRVKIPPPQLLKTQWYFARDFCKIPIFTLFFAAVELTNNILSGAQFNSSVLLYGFPYYSRPMPYDCYLDYIAKCWGPQTEPWQDRNLFLDENIKLLESWDYTRWTGTLEHRELESSEKSVKAHAATGDWRLGCTPLLGTHFGLNNTAVLMDYNAAATHALSEGVKRIAISFNRWRPDWPDGWDTDTKTKQQTPFTYRYSFREDRGRGNKIMLYTRECRAGVPEADNKLEDQPLYILANGYYDFINKHSLHNPLNWVCVVWCPYTYPPMEGVIPVNKDWFKSTLTPGENKAKNGNGPEKNLLRDWDSNSENAQYTRTKCKWNEAKNYCEKHSKQGYMQGTVIRAPDFIDSEEFFKNLYAASPFSWKLNRTCGNLTFTYQSYWSWGGDFPKQKPIEDPCGKPKWGTLPQSNYDERGVQIEDPKQQRPKAFIHEWDLRRGNLTSSALNRLMQLHSSGSDVDPDHSPQKKKRRHKDPLTTAEKFEPEEGFLYIPSPKKFKGEDGKSARDTFVDKNKRVEKLAEAVFDLWEENQRYRHRLRKHLRKNRDIVDQYRLLLG